MTRLSPATPPVDDPVARETSWAPMSSMDDSSGQYIFASGGPGRWVLRNRENSRRLVGLAVLAIVVMAFIVAKAGAIQGVGYSTLPLLVVFFMGLIYASDQVQAVVDTGKRRVWRPRGGSDTPWSVPLEDVHALQVLRRDDGTDVAECNLVLSTARRLHLVMQGGGEGMVRKARQLSSRLQVPVWEATLPPASETPHLTLEDFRKKWEQEEARAGDGPNVPAQLFSIQGATLLAANLAPVYGVLTGDWPVFMVFAVFWWETVIAGVMGVVRLTAATPFSAAWWRNARSTVIAFFLVHYGFLVWIQGWAIISFFGEGASTGGSPWDVAPLLDALTESSIGPYVLLFLVSHLVSFAREDLNRPDHEASDLARLLTTPYAGVAVLHVVLTLCLVALPFVSAPLIALAILVTLRIAADLVARLVKQAGAEKAPALEAKQAA